MPELPEVETIRRDLEQSVVARRVDSVTLAGPRTVRRQDPAVLVAALTGRVLAGAQRFGKYLVLPLASSAADCAQVGVLVVHLRMSGQLVHLDAAMPVERHTRARLRLDDASELRFVDPRTFGELFVTEELDEAGRPAELAGLGFDPLVDGLDLSRLREAASRRSGALKALLVDQRVIAGIGNIYADEILFVARLRPARSARSLSAGEWRRLAAAILDVLGAAVAARGSTLSDARYVDLKGAAGAYQHHHAVYGRGGEPCPRCGTPVTRVRLAGRSAHFCPRCQH